MKPQLDSLDEDYTVPQCPWSYRELLRLSPDELRILVSDPGMSNSVRQLLDHARRMKWKAIQEGRAPDPSVSPEAAEHEATPQRRVLYAIYLESDHWKEFRKKAVAAAGGRCQLCNRPNKRPQVHHKHYNTVGRETLGDVLVVCDPCHRRTHDLPPVPRVVPRRAIPRKR